MHKSKKFVIPIFALLIFSLMSSCNPFTTEPIAATPVDNTPTPPAQDTTPLPIETLPATGNIVFVDTIDLLILESFPVQIKANISGSLPDGCTTIEKVTAAREKFEFQIEIQTTRSGEICTEALVPFTYSLDLDVVGLKAGKYVVKVLDLSAEFELTVDNIFQEEAAEDSPEPEEEPNFEFAEKVYIDKVSTEISNAQSARVTIQIQGNLPDGCTKINEITHEYDSDQTFIIHIHTKRPTGTMCTMVLKPFDVTYELDVKDLPAGTYQVIVYDQTAAFTIQ